jgi:hypothetical protein
MHGGMGKPCTVYMLPLTCSVPTASFACTLSLVRPVQTALKGDVAHEHVQRRYTIATRVAQRYCRLGIRKRPRPSNFSLSFAPTAESFGCGTAAQQSPLRKIQNKGQCSTGPRHASEAHYMCKSLFVVPHCVQYATRTSQSVRCTRQESVRVWQTYGNQCLSVPGMSLFATALRRRPCSPARPRFATLRYVRTYVRT